MSMIPRQDVPWDVRRNTSMVHPVRPGSWRDALSALRAWREQNWKHAAWIIEGYPTMTPEQHRQRFGADYLRPKGKRKP